MLKKDASEIICFCLEYPKTLENPDYKRIYEEARKTIGAFEKGKKKIMKKRRSFLNITKS